MTKQQEAQQKIDSWVKQVKLYPIMEIYGGKDLAKSKEEKRVELICEDVFKLSSGSPLETLPKADMQKAYIELTLAIKLARELPVRPEYISKCKEEFLTSAKVLITLLDNTYKKEKVLQDYYMTWRIKSQDLKSLVYDL